MSNQLRPDRIYYAEHALAELEAAKAAPSLEVKTAHLQLADYYSILVADMDQLIEPSHRRAKPV